MFAGITFLNYWLGILPSQHITILAQMAKIIFGNSAIGNALFYVFQLSTALILAVATNTGFSAFQCCLLVWQKINTCPTCLWRKGRLGYSNGITLALGAILLLILSEGSTERLIPLYTIRFLFLLLCVANRDGYSLETTIW